MAVVGYQCSTCKRTINLIQNKSGLDWVGNCNITLGCRGHLIQQEVYPDYIRGSLPTEVPGLKDWVQRKVLYNFEQTVLRQTWVITHNLGTLPSVIVYVSVPTSGDPGNMVEVLPVEIIYNSEDQLTLILSKSYVGTAQLIARASNPDILNPRPRPPVSTGASTAYVSNSNTVTIATRVATTGALVELPVEVTYISSAGNQVNVGYIATNVPAAVSPWSDFTKIMFKGKTYLVRTFNVLTGNIQIPNGASVGLTGINPDGGITLSIVSFVPQSGGDNGNFVVVGDYSLYFIANSDFTITGTSSINDRVWIVQSSSYDPITNQTTIVPTDPIPNTFPLSGADIIQSGQRQIVKGEVIILLGTSPYTIYDKVEGSYIDFTSVDTVNTQFDLFYNAGEIVANTSIEQNVYPPIRSV